MADPPNVRPDPKSLLDTANSASEKVAVLHLGLMAVCAYLLGASFLIFIVNFAWTIIINPAPSTANPWDSLGLEWQTATPVPPDNFDRIPVVLNDPYHYSESGATPVADLGSTASAGSSRPGPEDLGPQPQMA